MEDALKCLKITIKILAKMSNSMWEVLLAMKEKMKQPTGIIMNTKAYMGTHRTKITVHRMSMDITLNYVEVFFANYGHVGVGNVAWILCKAAGDFGLQLTN